MNVDNWDQFKKLVKSVKETIARVKAENDEKPGTMGVLSFFKEKDEISHSKTIAFLLNPEGQHNKEDKFLKEFIKAVGLPIHICEKDLTSCEVQREEKNIDIFIKCKDFCIILENKKPGYGYKDQPNQLARYYNIALGKGYSEDKIYILYLTIDGYSPSNTSIECGSLPLNEKAETKIDENNKVINPSNGIINISYKKHILEWLKKIEESCLKNESLLKSGIMQYRYLIQILTKQTEEEKTMNEEIKKELREELKYNHELWALLKQITEVFPELEEENIIQKVKDIKELLVKKQLAQCSVIEKEHKVVIMSEQEPIDEGDIKTIKYLGVGIEIIPGRLTVAFEVANTKTSYIGLITHESDKDINLPTCIEELGFVVSPKDKWWYYSKELEVSTITPKNIVSDITKLYKKVKHIKL